MKILKNKNGYITLLSIIVVSSVGLAIILSISLISISSIRSSGDLYKSNQAKALANACAETALQEIRNLDSFTGNDNLLINNGACDYTVSDLGGENREITAKGNIGDIVRKVKVNINAINPQITIASWQEVSSF
jgi:hypothetical protein